MSASLIVDQLDALREEYPEAPLVVFVPRTQIGRSIEDALARRRRGWGDLQTLISRHYAEDVARIDILSSGRREAPVGAQLFRAARIVQALPEEARSDTLPGWHLLADTVASAIETLREGDVRIQAVQERAKEAGSSETLGVIASCYEAHVRELEEKWLYDDADVYRWARERVLAREAPEVPKTVYAVASAEELSEHAAQFLSALQTRGREFVRLGLEDPSDPPPEAAAARFPEVRIPEPLSREEDVPSSGTAGETRSDRFVRAVGAREEIKAVFRSLLREEIPFGDVTIAYAESQPYASLLADEAERVGIPLTMGTGLPAGHTDTGRALRSLYEWVREEYDPAILVRMLRAGLLPTDRWLRRPDEEGTIDGPSLKPHEAATLLAERSYEPGREGLLSGLSAAIRAINKDGKERADGLTSREETRKAQLEQLNAFVEALIDLVPRRGTIQEMAGNSCRFLERFGPTDAPSEEEEQRTPDEAARRLLYQRLQRLENIDVSCETRDRQLASLFQQWLSGQYVQAMSPRPGHVHVLPLESAGYSDRFHLYVVGLDSTTFSTSGAEKGMLQETDRRVLVSSLENLDGDNQRRTTPADEALWRASRALRRHQGRTCYYTRIFDVEAGEERDPSSLFLRKERLSSSQSGGWDGEEDLNRDDHEVVGLVPDEDTVSLSDLDLWLRAYRAGRRERPTAMDEEPEPTIARDRLAAMYPWVLDGEAARTARGSDRYTEHDGLLPKGDYSELGFFGSEERPLSASRLETLAEAPYIYFLKYVLGIRPLDEPALDDEPWLNNLRKGSLLHEIYERFMRGLEGAAPTTEHISRLRSVVNEVLEEEADAFAPPSPVVKETARRELYQNAVLFLRSEIDRSAEFASEYFELGFGFPPHRREQNDIEEAAHLAVGEEVLRLRGRIDRVDRHRETGHLVTWDYKTGRASSYDEEDPLQDGKTLQWALYAYALESLLDEEVEESGYFFANIKEVGTRVSAAPERYRSEVEELLRRLGALTETGSFPVTPDLPDVNAWKWGGYDRLVGDLRERKKVLKDKAYPEDRPKPPSF